MPLGTQNMVWALSCLPSGNVLAELAGLRERLFRSGLPGARAFFDCPVVAWSESAPVCADLERGAAALVGPLGFTGFVRHDDRLYLGFDTQSLSQLRDMGIGRARLDQAPFIAGLGLYCGHADQSIDLPPPPYPRFGRYRLAAYRLVWDEHAAWWQEGPSVLAGMAAKKCASRR